MELSGADVKALRGAEALLAEVSEQSVAALLLDLRAKVGSLPSLESLEAEPGSHVIPGSDGFDSCGVLGSDSIKSLPDASADTSDEFDFEHYLMMACARTASHLNSFRMSVSVFRVCSSWGVPGYQ